MQPNGAISYALGVVRLVRPLTNVIGICGGGGTQWWTKHQIQKLIYKKGCALPLTSCFFYKQIKTDLFILSFSRICTYLVLNKSSEFGQM